MAGEIALVILGVIGVAAVLLLALSFLASIPFDHR